MQILVINGPNLNMLGKRDPAQYGTITLAEIESTLKSENPDIAFTFLQSNHEGEIIEKLHTVVQKGGIDGLLVNFGAFTHTSVAIRDALEMVPAPAIEVHLSNIHARESFRHTSLTGGVCKGMVAGLGIHSYLLGMQALRHILKPGE